MTAVVLVHGGGLDSRCWDPLLPHLDAPAIAVDLPGRGAHPARLDSVTFADCAESVRADVDAAGFDDVVLVGHSLAGCSMPAIISLLGDRVRHAVFVACTVPDDGTSSFDMLDPEFQRHILEVGVPAEPRAMDEATARIVFGTDLTEEQFAWCSERIVPEAPRLNRDRVDLAPLRASACARTWVRTLQDIIVSADKQLRYADNVGRCRVVDLDAGHMCMVSQPEMLGAILNHPLVTGDPAITHWDGPGLDAWHPWTPAEAARELSALTIPWAVVGGWAIDLFLGKQTREHEDLEIAVLREHFADVRQALRGYVFHVVGDGEVRRLPVGEAPPPEKHQNWVLDVAADAWRVDVMLESGDDDTWVFRRDESIRAPRDFMTRRTSDGIPFLGPHGVLLYKAKAARAKDEADLEACLPHMTSDEREWLATMLERAHPGHPWIARMA